MKVETRLRSNDALNARPDGTTGAARNPRRAARATRTREAAETGESAPSAGDTIVYAFSYDASTGGFQFWDSKNNGSLTATSTPAGDFVRDRFGF